MTYLYAFLFSGTICVLGELVYKFTKLTPGHITSILVVIGSILEGFGIYEPLKEVFKGGISSLLSILVHLLLKDLMKCTIIRVYYSSLMVDSITLVQLSLSLFFILLSYLFYLNGRQNEFM